MTKEKETFSEVLKVCGYPQWRITSIKEKMAKKEVKVKENERCRRMIVISYMTGLSKRIAQVMRKRRITQLSGTCLSI